MRNAPGLILIRPVCFDVAGGWPVILIRDMLDFFLTNGSRGAIYRRMSMYQSTDLTAYAEVFKALSNPNRLAIFMHLVACCPPGTSCSFDEEIRQCVGDLGKGLNIGQSTISHHIKELRRAGLIHVEKRGKFTRCRVDGETVTLLANLLTGKVPIEGFSRESLPRAAGER
jgi:ArsR family transcriptional regulator, arsenate/arsenite/antimonite-responsive transcriptional repressor